ncbi:MAG: Gfo/Idh/MocA family oxidoreductase [Candidatus Latescibacteria bacterium]|nr:Gfo/Idh/MocA family oxidoreductase [Candidatus Latescibacterota bacterium]
MKLNKVAIVGCGRIAGSIDDEMPAGHPCLPYCHAGGYAALASTTLVAAADIDASRRASFCKRWGVSRDYDDYRVMIEQEQPDIVSVCTGQKLHAEITIFAAEHGVKGIYCEKAMCSSMAEADAMVAVLERNGVAFNLGVNRRFTGLFMAARRMIADGELGDLKWAQFTGNDLLMHGYSHAFDAICYLLGDPPAKWIAGQVAPYSGRTTPPIHCSYDPNTNRWDRDPGGCWATIAFEGGAMGQAANPTGMPMYEWQVVGTEGVLHIRDYGEKIAWRKGDGYEKLEVPFPEYPRKSPTVGLIENLLLGMETGEPTRANARVSRAVTELCLANAESHVRGAAPVGLPLENRTLYIPSH